MTEPNVMDLERLLLRWKFDSQFDETAEELAKRILAAPAVEQQAVQHCAWSQDGSDDTDVWGTSCGEYFCLNEGTPKENNIKFCNYCGKPVEEHPYVYEPESDC